MQFYTDPTRESDPTALPNAEVWYVDFHDAARATSDDPASLVGWYWQACFPGCLPEGDPIGPFATEAEAIEDARNGAGEQ